jgi:hypothetical protein
VGPLAERIVAMHINTAGLLALEAAVNNTAEQYNIPTFTAAFRLFNDIKDYNKLGDSKKQLAALCAQVYTVKQVCSHQNQAIVALVNLQGYGITEDDILNLNNYVERNRHNINPDLHGHIEGDL